MDIEVVEPEKDNHVEFPACKVTLEGKTERNSGILVLQGLTGPNERTGR